MYIELPKAQSLDERDEIIQKHLEDALAYMKTGDPAKGPVAKMYAEFIIEVFNNTEGGLRP